MLITCWLKNIIKAKTNETNCNNRRDGLIEEDEKIENNEQEREQNKVEYHIASDAKEQDEYEEEDERDCKESFFQLQKTQKQLEEHTVEIKAKLRKKENQIKEK